MAKEEAEEEAERAIGLGQVSSRHINKRAFRNKALAISFNDKDLKKKKGRKEAQQKIKEKDRLKRIEKRKQRKQERAYVHGSGPADGSEPEGGDLEQDEEIDPKAPVAATKKYDAGELTIMVTTSEISCEEEDNQKTHIIPRSSDGTEKKLNIPVNKKPQFKATPRRRSGSKAKDTEEKIKKEGKGKERKGKVKKIQ